MKTCKNSSTGFYVLSRKENGNIEITPQLLNHNCDFCNEKAHRIIETAGGIIFQCHNNCAKKEIVIKKISDMNKEKNEH